MERPIVIEMVTETPSHETVAAQTQSSLPLRAKVPFDFVVGNQTLHASQYTVEQGKVGGLVMLECGDRREHGAATGVPIESKVGRSATTKLVFPSLRERVFSV
jgi:hypothetical protein